MLIKYFMLSLVEHENNLQPRAILARRGLAFGFLLRQSFIINASVAAFTLCHHNYEFTIMIHCWDIRPPRAKISFHFNHDKIKQDPQ